MATRVRLAALRVRIGLAGVASIANRSISIAARV